MGWMELLNGEPILRSFSFLFLSLNYIHSIPGKYLLQLPPFPPRKSKQSNNLLYIILFGIGLGLSVFVSFYHFAMTKVKKNVSKYSKMSQDFQKMFQNIQKCPRIPKKCSNTQKTFHNIQKCSKTCKICPKT